MTLMSALPAGAKALTLQMIFGCVCLFVSAASWAEDVIPTKDIKVDQVTGRYYKRTYLRNDPAMFGGRDKDYYFLENKMEIIKQSENKAYFRLELEFYNGHRCSLSGMSKTSGSSLSYHAKQDELDGKLCVLNLNISGDQIILEDVGGICQSHSCGARGYYTGITFNISKRRKIHYMDRLKNSKEFVDALKEDVARGE